MRSGIRGCSRKDASSRSRRAYGRLLWFSARRRSSRPFRCSTPGRIPDLHRALVLRAGAPVWAGGRASPRDAAPHQRLNARQMAGGRPRGGHRRGSLRLVVESLRQVGCLRWSGLVVGPDGELLGLTSASEPFVSVRIDLEAAKKAKRTYPRYAISGSFLVRSIDGCRCSVDVRALARRADADAGRRVAAVAAGHYGRMIGEAHAVCHACLEEVACTPTLSGGGHSCR